MKLLTLSDLHVEYNERRSEVDILQELADFINESAPDRVLVAGDMAGGSAECLRCIDDLEQRTGVPLSYLPGNHSIWSNKKESDTASWDEYEKLRAHHSSLIDNPVHLTDEWVLLGDMGWYDYTLADPSYTSRSEIVRDKHTMWKDAFFAKWGMEDEELCEQMLGKFERLLEAHQDKKIVFANHFIPYDRFVTRNAEYPIFRIISPYMGSRKIGELLDRYSQVQYVVFGHTHRRWGTVEHHGKQVICNPLGYVSEWRTNDPKQEIRKSATMIEL